MTSYETKRNNSNEVFCFCFDYVFQWNIPESQLMIDLELVRDHEEEQLEFVTDFPL